MSDDLAVPMQPALPRISASETRALAQVEKWMALIREIKRERAAT